MKILVCDDNLEDMNNACKLCNQYLEQRDENFCLSGTDDSKEALSGDADILILDIEMPGQNGLEIKEALEGRSNGPYIIFATNYPDVMQEAFGSNVIGFIVKPIAYDRLAKLIDKALILLAAHKLVKFSDGSVINSSHINYITVNCGYAELFLNTGRHRELIRKSLKTWEEELQGCDFIRIDEDCIINCSFIERFDGNEVLLKDGTSRKVSRRRRKNCFDMYLNYCSKMAKYL